MFREIVGTDSKTAIVYNLSCTIISLFFLMTTLDLDSYLIIRHIFFPLKYLGMEFFYMQYDGKFHWINICGFEWYFGKIVISHTMCPFSYSSVLVYFVQLKAKSDVIILTSFLVR